MIPRELIRQLAIAEQLKDTMRHSYTSKGRKESVAEHSWRLALMALLVSEDFAEIDMNKVIAMCLLHDMGEAFTGDIPAFEKTDSDSAFEASAIDGWLRSLPDGLSRRFGDLFDEMEEMETKESKLYKALDKLEALIQHNEAALDTWLPLEYDLQMTYGTEECAYDERIKAIRDLVREDSVRKIEQEG